MDVLSLSLCHIVVVVIMFTCEHVSHRSGGESNPDRSDESTEYNPLHCVLTVNKHTTHVMNVEKTQNYAGFGKIQDFAIMEKSNCYLICESSRVRMMSVNVVREFPRCSECKVI